MSASSVEVRPVSPEDASTWLRLRCNLWPGRDNALASEVKRYFESPVPSLDMTLLAEIGSKAVGFAEVSIRAYAEGCATENVGYLEAWYVASSHRHTGVGRALVQAAEQWARDRGCAEFASDTQPENELGQVAHLGCGFEEVGLVRCFKKPL